MIGEMLAEMTRQEETYEEAMQKFPGINPERLRLSENDKKIRESILRGKRVDHANAAVVLAVIEIFAVKYRAI